MSEINKLLMNMESVKSKNYLIEKIIFRIDFFHKILEESGWIKGLYGDYVWDTPGLVEQKNDGKGKEIQMFAGSPFILENSGFAEYAIIYSEKS